MTKKHHPHNRAERLALKIELDEKAKITRASIRRRIIRESLKERETEDELKQYT